MSQSNFNKTLKQFMDRFNFDESSKSFLKNSLNFNDSTEFLLTEDSLYVISGNMNLRIPGNPKKAVDVDYHSLIPELKSLDIIPDSFEYEKELAREIVTEALFCFRRSDRRFLIKENLNLLRDLRKDAKRRVDKIRKEIINLSQLTVPQSFPQLYVGDMARNYEKLLQEEKRWIKVLDSKLRTFKELKDQQKFFKSQQPHRFVLYLDFLHRKYFPRNEDRKKYGVPAKDEWISNVLNYYGFEKEPKEKNDEKEIDVDYVRIIISRAKKQIPDYKGVFQQYEESG